MTDMGGELYWSLALSMHFQSDYISCLQCPHCLRRFARGKLAVHLKACKDVFGPSRRLPFDGKRQRLLGTPMEAYNNPTASSAKKASPTSTAGTNRWKGRGTVVVDEVSRRSRSRQRNGADAASGGGTRRSLSVGHVPYPSVRDRKAF